MESKGETVRRKAYKKEKEEGEGHPEKSEDLGPFGREEQTLEVLHYQSLFSVFFKF